MKVYLLKFIDAHDEWIEGVYASYELAAQRLEDEPELYDGWAMHFIKEYEVKND